MNNEFDGINRILRKIGIIGLITVMVFCFAYECRGDGSASSHAELSLHYRDH